MPTRKSPIASSVVPTCRRMKGSEIDAITTDFPCPKASQRKRTKNAEAPAAQR